MFIINVKEKGKHIDLKYKKYVSPCVLKFRRLAAFQECLEYLKQNGIGYYTTEIADRNPIRKYSTSNTIKLNAYIGGRQ